MEKLKEEYLLFERDPAYIEEVNECKDEAVFIQRFKSRIAFGTAGLRGPMRWGVSGMNCGTVWRATQGLCQYWIDQIGLDECIRRGAVIGFDGRHGSEYFASIACAVFMTKGIPVIFADAVTATPLTPYAVVKTGAFCGVQITASHNPKQDNGYKVYSSNGAQIVPPMDKDIATAIERQSIPWLEVDDIVDHALKRLNPIHPQRKLAHSELPDIWSHFKNDVLTHLGLSRNELSNSSLKVVYTAMHGVGFRFIENLIVHELGFPSKQFFPVKEQVTPDPEFSTVKFPNPEEKGALDLAKTQGVEVDADLIIANDPDADRFAALERLADGTWRSFSGDELGAIFGMIAYEKWEQSNRSHNTRCSLVCSAVSGTFLRRYAAGRRAEFKETLTGFKWMVNVALQMKHDHGVDPCFCYEEALGYGLLVEQIPDKCGLSAAAAFIRKASELKKCQLTMTEWLEARMRENGGYFATENSYYVAGEPSITKSVIQGFRQKYLNEFKKSGSVSMGGFKVNRIRDLATNYDSAAPDLSCELPCIEEMLTLEFENGSRITLRGSGTEPKLKYYSEQLSAISVQDAKESLSKQVRSVMEELLGEQRLVHASEL